MDTQLRSAPERPEATRRWWTPVVVPLLVTLAYVALIFTVNGLERRSEMAKLSRGVFTDTLSPTLGTELITLPASTRVTGNLPNYPTEFDATAYRRVFEVRSSRLRTVGLEQAAVGLPILVVLSFAKQALDRRKLT